MVTNTGKAMIQTVVAAINFVGGYVLFPANRALGTALMICALVLIAFACASSPHGVSGSDECASES